ncbi:uncharacterized protein GGS25DRAFT_497493 [Hypoxylon fragiforme]|uniref:uncharacterized protein n=1 Tax=Hypoxylon fragiforme TaxID=63214 RepID=UPI0020C74121|nr:uncharacterized protein GGS25DRAFT_497493 [Hypoxylon fragiforme]KAI2605664.1 hypothetical protein GGS25DRAFT_497493 [Hypoxylon fragiforme]
MTSRFPSLAGLASLHIMLFLHLTILVSIPFSWKGDIFHNARSTALLYCLRFLVLTIFFFPIQTDFQLKSIHGHFLGATVPTCNMYRSIRSTKHVVWPGPLSPLSTEPLKSWYRLSFLHCTSDGASVSQQPRSHPIKKWLQKSPVK